MKRAFLILFCLVVVAVALCTLVWAPKKLPPRVAFPAGDSAILHKLTYGTNHLAPKPPGWPLPSFARSWLFHLGGMKPEFRNLTTPEPSLVLWIENTRPGTPPSGPMGLTWLMIADETGQAAGRRVNYSGRGLAWKSTVAFPSWPCSSPKLTIRWFEVTGHNKGSLKAGL